MTDKQLRTLRKRQPKNYADIIAQSMGLSKSTIIKVLHGVRNNNLVIEAAKNLADEYHKKVQGEIQKSI